MKTTNALTVLLSTTWLVACASPAPVVDNSPLIRTAVVKTTIQNSGIKGFFANETEQTVNVMDQVSRIDNEIKFTGSLLGRFGSKQSQSDIVRLDRGVEWSLDNKSKNYRECPLGGCKTTSFGFEALQQDEGFEGNEEDFDESCQISITENTLKMAPTGETRLVNGYQSSEHLFEWTVRGKDEEGKTFLSEITAVNWMTPITGEIAEVVNMHATFDRNYRNSLPDQYPDKLHDVISDEALEVFLKAFTAGMSEEEKTSLLNKFDGLSVPEGYSVSNKLTWQAKDETCAAPKDPEQAEEDSLDTGSFAGLLKSVGEKVVKQEIDKKKAEKAREIELRPILTVLTEVKSIEITEIRESQLSVPEKYKLVNRN